MITVWGRINSHNVKKVVWAVAEAGVPFNRVDMGGSFGYSPAYEAINPNRMVPAISDGAVHMWESNAILRYLADAHAPQLRADDPATRAAGDKWMDWQFHFADAQRDSFLGVVRHGKDASDPAVAASARASEVMMAMLDAELAERPWLSGERFGIADMPMGVYAHTYFKLGIPRPDLPHLAAWYAKLLQRPAFADIAAVPLT
jgi:glutathione S-transferase